MKDHLVRLKESTINRLKPYGKFGDSYDDVVNVVLDKVTKKGKKK